jgi:hypothetical protein
MLVRQALLLPMRRARAPALQARCIHAKSRGAAFGGKDEDFQDNDGDEGRGGGGRRDGPGVRRGRPFLDPAAPRRMEAIRKDPMHSAYGGTIDILEHSAYSNIQREENEEGFFFDNTRPEFDSDEEGDPFSAAYLTEDEYEFPADYKPAPYTPGKVADAIWHSYSVKKVPIPRLVQQYAMPTYKITAIINLKEVSPAFPPPLPSKNINPPPPPPTQPPVGSRSSPYRTFSYLLLPPPQHAHTHTHRMSPACVPRVATTSAWMRS